MKRRYLFLVSLICAFNALSQKGKTLVVYDIKGVVINREGKQKDTLHVGKRISEESIFILGSKDTLILLDPRGLNSYSLHGSYIGTLGTYLKKDASNTIKTTKMYMNYLLSKAMGENTPSPEDSHASVIREMPDQLEPIDSASIEKGDTIQ